MGDRLLQDLDLFQLGKEGTFDLAVAADMNTSLRFEFETLGEKLRPQGARGFTMNTSGDETIVSRGTTWTIPEQPVSYADLHWVMGASVKGGVTIGSGEQIDISGTGTDEANEYTFLRQRSDVLAPDSFTIERRQNDGSATIDHEWAGCYLANWTLNFVTGAPVTLSASGFGGKIQDSTLTALSLDETIKIARAHRCGAFMDALWADIAGAAPTTIGAEVLRSSVLFNSGFSPLRSLTANQSLEHDAVQFDPRASGFEMELVVLAKSGGAELYETLKSNAENLVNEGFRLACAGAVLGDSAPAKSRLIDIIGFGQPELDTLMAKDVEEGQTIVTVKIVPGVNAVSTFQYFQVIIQNDIAAI